MQKYDIDRRIISTEAELYIFPNSNDLFKHFYCFSDYKKETIELLDSLRKAINIQELEIPNSLVKINNRPAGCSIKKIDGTNLSFALNNRKIDIKQKIDYFKQIGAALDKLSKFRKQNNCKTFFINDLHEDNCIIDKNNQIHIIDLDSCKLKKEHWYPSKHLCHIRDSKLNKYKDNAINQDTDYYCYCIMILDFLLRERTQELRKEEFDQYLDYLYKIGFDYNLINCFSKIYMDVPNENPYKLLDTIDNNIYRANYYTFKANQKHL